LEGQLDGTLWFRKTIDAMHSAFLQHHVITIGGWQYNMSKCGCDTKDYNTQYNENKLHVCVAFVVVD
jgi:hypothetical protein